MSLFKITVSVLAVGASADIKCTKDADCTAATFVHNHLCREVYKAGHSTCTNERDLKVANDKAKQAEKDAQQAFLKEWPAEKCSADFVKDFKLQKTNADCVCKSDDFRLCTVPAVMTHISATKETAEQQAAASAKFVTDMTSCLCTHARSCDTDKECPALPSDAPVAGTILAGAVAAAAYMA